MICKALSLHDLSALVALLNQYPELNWTPQMLADSLHASQNQVFGLFENDLLRSFTLFQVVAQEAELLLIVTERTACQRGYATQLLTYCFTLFNSIFLEVREQNQAARSLYEKLGFVSQGLRKQYYTQPPEHAVQYHINTQKNKT